MNDFEYALKLKELDRLKTKKSKIEFIRNLSYTTRKSPSVNNIRLVIKTYEKFNKQKITGCHSLKNFITQVIGHNIRLIGTADFDPAILDLDLAVLNETVDTSYNAMSEFIRAAGIPAYMKMAVLKAKYERMVSED